MQHNLSLKVMLNTQEEFLGWMTYHFFYIKQVFWYPELSISVKVSATCSLSSSLSLPKFNLQASDSSLIPTNMIVVVGRSKYEYFVNKRKK